MIETVVSYGNSRNQATVKSSESNRDDQHHGLDKPSLMFAGKN